MSDVNSEPRAQFSTPKKAKGAANFLSKILFLILLVALIVVGFLYYQTKQELTQVTSLEGQELIAQKEAKEVTDSLKKLTILPEEEPVIATILDVQLLASQSAFYKNAENGDKLVIYPTAQKAYIYSPTKKVIVNAGPLVVDQNENTRPVLFEIRNGSIRAADAQTVKTELEKNQQVVAEISPASRQDYSGTYIIPINPAIQPEQLTEFAQQYDAEVMPKLPAGEDPSSADILIIVGEQGESTPAADSSPAP